MENSGHQALAGQCILVTGATGFLGGAVARALQRNGVQVIAHGRDEAAGYQLEMKGMRVALGPLEDAQAMDALIELQPLDAIVHCAAKSAPFGPHREFFAANVNGTSHLLESASAAGIQRFVHISSPSIYCAGRPLDHVAENAKLPSGSINHYAATKRLAEGLVQVAHSRGLPTVTLRPRAIYGPGDSALFPRLLRALEDGKLPVIGDGQNRIDLTYIDDAVQGVLCALVAGPHCLGKTYNLTSGEPALLWELINDLCARLDLAPPTRRVSRSAARVAAFFAEGWHRLAKRPGEPRLTRYSVDSLSLDATLDISAARRDLGYEPRVSVEEGLTRFIASLQGPGATP